ncbi:hypothetical protein J3459_010242 [Metarhizium acridum]|nr:hypothetical protein J3459_010242 [Metarhizium acridum]
MAHAHINHSNIHFKWSKNIPPVLAVKSGAELDFDLKDGFNNLVRPGTTAAQLLDLDTSQTDPAFGPVAVEGAEPGDVLRVDILELTPAPYGWTAVFPGFGLLRDEFPGPHLNMWDLSTVGEGYAEFRKGIRVPTPALPGCHGPRARARRRVEHDSALRLGRATSTASTSPRDRVSISPYKFPAPSLAVATGMLPRGTARSAVLPSRPQ